MTTPINLNKARKAKARADAKKKADQNAVVHGMPKSRLALDKARRDKAKRALDGLKRDDT